MTTTTKTTKSPPRKKTWRTAISRFDERGLEIAGYRHEDLMRELDFSSMLFVLFQQRVPSKNEARLLDALMISAIDHSIVASSAVTRIVAASGTPLQSSVAAGILTIGDIHGGAGQELSRRLEEWVKQAKEDKVPLADKARSVVRALRETGERLEGYGHPLYPTKGDPRVAVLVDLARKLDCAGPHLELALELSEAIREASGKYLPMNVDGAIAAMASDLGFDWRLGRAFIFIPRAAGLAAHAVEEATREPGWRKITSGDEIEYDGPESRTFPQRS